MAPKNPLRQPPRRLPLRSSLAGRVADLGVIGLQCRLDFWFDAGPGRPEPVPFVIDSGASHSMMSLLFARSRGIPVPPPEAEVDLTLRSARGVGPLRVRPGRIRVWWDAGRRGYPFDWPVLFRVDAPLGVPSVLGLGGVVTTCRWTFDGDYSPDAPFGCLTLDDVR